MTAMISQSINAADAGNGANGMKSQRKRKKWSVKEKMLIRAQDRTCVCNTEKMNGISIAEKSDGTAFLTMRFSGYPGDNCALGTYGSKGRATEVLDGICNAYEGKWRTFTMPEK